MANALEQYLLSPLEELAKASIASPWDAVVVGGGTAGLTAARTLAERGKRVAVLEGGSLALLTHSTTTDLRFDPAGLTRFRELLQYSPRRSDGGQFGFMIACFGSRAMFWNGAAPRFAEGDFASWPIKKADIDPFYSWAELEMRVSRDYGDTGLGQTALRQLRESGLPAELGPYAIDTHPTSDGWIGGTLGNPMAVLLRTSLVTAAEPALRMAGHAFATKILLGAGGKAAAVTVTDRSDGASYEVETRSVVLAGGGFESVRLAIASGLPDRSGLLGRRIVDHLFCRAYYPVPDTLYDPAQPEAAIVAVPADEMRGFQLELHLPSDNLFMLSELSTWKPSAGDPFYAAMVRSFAPVAPRDDNFVEAGAGDAPGDYTVHLTYSPDDLQLLDEMVAGLDSVRAALGGERAEAERFTPGDSHHEAGGMLMGSDPTSSVTDPYGRLWSTPNVVVADAASWPCTSAANPCLTITALSRRQALQLSEDLGQS
jgi:choline dehydrogenase-like flavoprotein